MPGDSAELTFLRSGANTSPMPFFIVRRYFLRHRLAEQYA